MRRQVVQRHACLLVMLMAAMFGDGPLLRAENVLPLTPLEVAGPREHTALAFLVQQYLAAGTAEEAQELEARILAHPDAMLPTLTELLRRPRPYGREPVGAQPGLSLTVRGTAVHYGLFVPPSYDPAQSYPLVVCLHGYGFSGDTYLNRWIPRLGEHYLLACPTYPESAWWTRFGEELVLATIREVKSRYHVDTNRIFLTGMSNGGIGAWIIGMHHADVFAGIAPMASGVDDVLFPFVENLRHTPVYVIHGAADQIMPVELSRALVEEMITHNIPHVYREHHGTHPHAGGHFFPRQELPALVKWFDVQRRSSLVREVSVVRDATHLVNFYWTRIDATDQIAAFSDNLVDGRDQRIRQKMYATLRATLAAPNHIAVQAQFVRRYSLFLNDALIDMSQPLLVETNGRRSFQGLVQPDRKILLRQARLRQDPDRVFPVRLTISVPPTN